MITLRYAFLWGFIGAIVEAIGLLLSATVLPEILVIIFIFPVYWGTKFTTSIVETFGWYPDLDFYINMPTHWMVMSSVLVPFAIFAMIGILRRLYHASRPKKARAET